jgi:hypothetical protein
MPVMTRIGWYGMPFVLIVLYVNIGESFYYKKYTKAVRNSLSKYLIYMFLDCKLLGHSHMNIVITIFYINRLYSRILMR